MSPEITTAMAAIAIVDKMGGWSVGGVLLFVSVTPALFIYLSARIVVVAINGLSKQLIEFKADYKNNITFVENYEKLVNRLEDTLRTNNIVTTKLVDRIDTRRETL